MAQIKPFKGFRYNLSKVKPEDVITLPYDKINPSLQDDYYARSPYNLVRILLGKEEPNDNETQNKYLRAKEFLAKWQKEKVLLQEKRDAIYLYDQHYTVPGTQLHRVRRSFIALTKLEDFESGGVRPHEKTLSKPKQDRIRLLQSTEAHFGLIFMLYDDPSKKISQSLGQLASHHAPIDFVDDQQVRNRLWVISDPDVIAQVQAVMKDKTLLIADGHHRYETALAIKKEKESQADASRFEYAMMAFVNLNEEGLTVLPTHRLVKNQPHLDKEDILKKCESFFNVSSSSNSDELFQRLEKEPHAFGAYFQDQTFYCLSLKEKNGIENILKLGVRPEVAKLDVTLLHRLILEGVLQLTPEKIAMGEVLGYCRDKQMALREVNEGKSQVAFFINPTKVKEVQEVCLAGEVLPQKSTDFYPKLLSGMVVHKL